MKREIRKISQSFKYAKRGIILCSAQERNFRIHTCAALYVLVLGFMAKVDKTQISVLFLCFAVMMSAELVNTAIERLCDKSASGYDNMVRDAKDIAAGAVFVCSLFCILIGLFIFANQDAITNILSFLEQHRWSIPLILLSMPIAIAYIFGYTLEKIKKQRKRK